MISGKLSILFVICWNVLTQYSSNNNISKMTCSITKVKDFWYNQHPYYKGEKYKFIQAVFILQKWNICITISIHILKWKTIETCVIIGHPYLLIQVVLMTFWYVSYFIMQCFFQVTNKRMLWLFLSLMKLDVLGQQVFLFAQESFTFHITCLL